ncbi:hypothetical protein [Kitasatospora sp. NPDC047058]|uniref:hypothetical protein n=1 Tax=Kitasatospora sp. NPDC047058 TaxID=3155620 RepID=UPI0033D0A4CE
MRKSVITASAKNVRPLSARRRLAAVAAGVVLAGGVQLLTTDTAWAACGDGPKTRTTTEAKPVTPASAHKGELQAGFHMTPDGQTITAGGAKVEIGVGVTNFTGAPYENVSATIHLYNKKGANRLEDFTVEEATPGGWKTLALHHGCDPTIFADTTGEKEKSLSDGRAAHFMFRVSVRTNASADLDDLEIYVGGKADGYPLVQGGTHTFKVVHPSAPAKPATPKPAPSKPATAAKPTDKPAATAKPSAKPGPAAEPAADTTATTAPKSTPTTAPATTAPAGTPELAQTGSSERNTFLAASAAVFVALGAGVLIAVRRLRPRR